MKLAIQICSELEWGSTKSILKIGRRQLRKEPYGEYFNYRVGKHRSIIYQSGATKTRTAAGGPGTFVQSVLDIFTPLEIMPRWNF